MSRFPIAAQPASKRTQEYPREPEETRREPLREPKRTHLFLLDGRKRAHTVCSLFNGDVHFSNQVSQRKPDRTQENVFENTRDPNRTRENLRGPKEPKRPLAVVLISLLPFVLRLISFVLAVFLCF